MDLKKIYEQTINQMKLNESSEFQGIQIVGDQNFIQKTKDALWYVKTCDLPAFQIIQKYIKRIHVNGRSGMDPRPPIPTFYVSPKIVNGMKEYYASGIVHDSIHSKLYHEKKEWMGRNAENICLDAQISFFQKSDLPELKKKYYIDYLNRMKTVDYFSDWKNRNW